MLLLREILGNMWEPDFNIGTKDDGVKSHLANVFCLKKFWREETGSIFSKIFQNLVFVPVSYTFLFTILDFGTLKEHPINYLISREYHVQQKSN